MLVGCGCSMGNTPKAKVEEFLNSYRKLDAGVIAELDNDVKKEGYTTSQQEIYKDVLKKQYADLKYTILEEIVDGDDATVTAEIEVYDLYKVQEEAASYLAAHPDEFNNASGVHDKEKFLTYKLEEMKKVKETVKYTLSFSLTKDNSKWAIKELSTDMLEKIHGVYDYNIGE